MKKAYSRLITAVLIVFTCSAFAETIGYWRFENPANIGQDYSGNHRDLSLFNNPVLTNVAASGACSNFPSVIPQNGQQNATAVKLPNLTSLYRPYEAAFSVGQQFTIEAYINLTNAAGGPFPIVSRYQAFGTPNPLAWVFSYSGGRLRMAIFGTNSSGTVTTVGKSTTVLAVQNNRDYYVAASYNAGTVTFYLADLSSPSPVLTNEVVTGYPTNITTTTQPPFIIGAYAISSTASNYFTGIIDEVRYSSIVLPASNLLAYASTSKPVFDQAPANVEVAVGANATFTAVASGAPGLNYQWYNGATQLPISGATNTSLTISNVGLVDSGKSYFIEVTNSYGSVTSSPPVVLSVVDVTGPTVGYWRFENGGNLGLDSGSGGVNLTGQGGTPGSMALPASGGGAGGDFPKNVPPGGATNISGLWLDGASWLYRNAGMAVAVSNQMTIETFFNVSNVLDNVTMPIAGQWDESAGQQSWFIGVLENNAAEGSIGDMQLRFGLKSGGGTVWRQSASRWVIQQNHDYYAAVTVNGTNVTFYLADLSQPNPTVESQSYGSSVSSVSAALSSFAVGRAIFGTNSVAFPGLLDEVRFSRVALAGSDFLLPPPAAPTIQLQPQDTAVASSANATFSVAALGDVPLHYQWYLGNTSTPITGATNTTLLLTNVTMGQNGTTYLVVVTNSYGSATSAPPAVLTVVDVSLPVVGYWRFEDANNLGLDLSGNGLYLTNSGSAASYTLPDAASGSPGALFPKTVGGQTNINGLSLDATSYLYHGAWPSFALGKTMTIEAFFNASYFLNNDNSPIASQWTEIGNQRSWFLSVKDTGGGTNPGPYQLRFAISSDGATTAWSQTVSAWNLDPQKDYYVAVVVTNGNATFYLADYSSTNTALRSQTYTTGVTNIFNANSDYRVGGMGNSSGGVIGFAGYIDEVRLSRVAQDPFSLLNPPPLNPQITSQPVDQTVAESNSATFSVTASGAPPLSYQWYRGPVGSPTLIAGASAATLTITNAQLAQSGNTYFVIVTNLYGQATSSVAMLNVNNTIGYWRFENLADLGLDSGSSGLQLTNVGTPFGYTLPSTIDGGIGANFSKTIPSTGVTNVSALQLDGSASYLDYGVNPIFKTTTQMTVEVYFNASNLTANTTMPLVGKYVDINPGRSWLFGVRKDGTTGLAQLRFIPSGDGVIATPQNATSWNLTTNHDYYAAVVFNAGVLQFYLADLSGTNSAVQVQAFTNATTSLYDAASDFKIGSYQGASAAVAFNGVLDEVRVSRAALSSDRLLIASPVPAIVTQPQGQTVLSSSNATFSVTASGLMPLSYQWYLGSVGNPLNGAVGSTLVISNAQPAQSGNTYFVIVTNQYGQATSTAATLTVIENVPSTMGTIRWLTGTVEINGVGVSGLNYSVLRTTNLALPNAWTVISSNIPAGTNGNIQYIDPAPPLPAGYYRFKQP